MNSSCKIALAEIDAMVRNEKYEEALDRVDELARMYPDEASIWRTRAYAKSRQGDLSAAILDVTKAIGICNIEPDYFFTRGILLFKQGNYSDAVEDFTRVLELCDLHSSDYYREGAHFCRADSFLRLGEWEKATADCARVKDGMRAWTDRLRTKEEMEGECRRRSFGSGRSHEMLT